MPVALITGASLGLGRALARDLSADGWSLVLDARGAERLAEAVTGMDPARTRALAGDVTDHQHRVDLVAAAWDLGGLDLLVNNASHLGPSPMPRLADYPTVDLARVLEVDVVAPHALLREALPLLRRTGGTVVDISSDAAVEAYEGWGGYGAAKAALDHLSAVLAAEEPDLRVYAVDPGDMRTAMHQAAFPGEDISDRPEPETVVPALRALLDRRPPSGRYRAADLVAGGAAVTAETLVEGTVRYAAEPPEARGLARDGVRLLVARPGTVEHTRFRNLPAYLRPGDLVVVNTSATLAAAVDGQWAGAPVTVHFSAALPEGTWAVELRPGRRADGPVEGVRPGDVVELPGGRLVVASAYPDETAGGSRLWRVRALVPAPVPAYLRRHGRPIAYSYVPDDWPLESYQTVFAVDEGSAEMPSAGRPFTDRMVTSLVTAGVLLAPVTLHAGVSSAEAGEPPFPEPYRVPAHTAALVEHTKVHGGRVVAVGTTVTRALETVADEDGRVSPGSGWTDLVLGPDRPARVVDGLVTGWHDAGASHLLLLEAVAGCELVAAAYSAARAEGYLWHELGDAALLLP